jgi:hypothetical protein
MSNFEQTILNALDQQEDWIATLTPEQQSEVRVHMALIELAILTKGENYAMD